MSDSKLSCQRFVVYDHLMFCLSLLSAHYLGNNFVYVNWIVELCHYQTKMLIFFFLTEVSLDVKALITDT